MNTAVALRGSSKTTIPVQAAFDRAGEPKKLVTLPYDTVGLYSEPGLGVAMRHAIAWYDRYLLADAKAEAEAEAEALSRARPRSP